MSANGTAVEFNGVSFTAGGKKLVRNLSFQVRKGERVVLIGRSGSGKTTTLKLINRLLDPSDGDILVEGRATLAWDVISLRRRIGYVIQETGLFPHFTIFQNVALVPRLEKWGRERIESRVRELLRLVGLDPDVFARRYPRELSGGQRQRVGVARALAADPPIVLMDEPFGALDPVTRSEIQKEFAALTKKLNKTIVFVTHDIHEAFLLGDRIGLFKDGEMIELSTPAELLDSGNEEARTFTGMLK